jgi:glycosyltransferase involved in cell wall biosynthesis
MHFKFDSDYVHRARQRVAMVVLNPVLGDSRVLKTAQTVSKLGFQVCLYGMTYEDASIPTSIQGYPFEIVLLPNPRFEMERSGKWSPDIENIDWNEVTNVFARHLQEQLEQKPPEFVHTHDMVGLAVGGKLYQWPEKRPFSWIHDIHEYVRKGTFMPESTRSFFSRIEEEFIHCPDVLTSVSPALNEILQDFYSLPRKPALVLNTPRCSDFDPYYPKDVRTALGIRQDVPLLVYIGNVKAERGMEILVEALPILPEIHVAIVTNSSGSYVWELMSTARKMEVAKRIHFHPYVPFCNVTSFLRTATVGIHPMLRHPDAELALPNKIFEYMHAGLPSVVSDNHAMKEFVNQHDCGLAFEASKARSLAEAVTHVLERLRSEPSWRQSIQALSQQYCWEVQESVIAGIYDGLAGHRGRDTAHSSVKRNYRVLHLPEASAGLPSTFASAMKQKGVSASSLRFAHSAAAFQYQADVILEKAPNDLTSSSQILKDLMLKYDIFHFHARPLLLSAHYPFPSGMDMLLLRAAGKKVFFHFHGSEARLASVFKTSSPYNYVAENPSNLFTTWKEDEQRIFFEFAKGICNDVFVLDPELQSYVGEALIVPRVVDLRKWAFVGTDPGEVLRVVHAPSRRGGKGTGKVLSVVEKLQSEGIRIEFRLVENVPHEEAREIYRWADVVIDQLRTGWYGVLAVEAMALGKAVVCYIRDDLKHYLPHPPPLAVANPDNLYSVLKDLALHPEEVRSLGQRGRMYVEELHDAEKVIDILLRIYEAEGNPFDIDKAVKLLSFQSEPPISKPLIRKSSIRWPLISKLWTRKAYINKQSFVSFFRVLRYEGVRVAVRRAYDLFFR